MATTQIQNTQNSPKRLGFFGRLKFLTHGLKKGVLLLYGIFFLVSLFLILVYDRCTLHVIINQYHAPFFDFFFKYVTYLGDGAIFGVVIVIFAFIKRRMILVFALTGVITLLLTYIFKKVLFHGSYRPAMDVGVDSLYLVDGVDIALWGTFPSGHTLTIFAVMTVLCLYFRQSKWQYLWISLALIVAFSRVYLSMHFLNDIFVGSTFGIFAGFVSMGLFYRVQPNPVKED